jgi:hypothetical protein
MNKDLKRVALVQKLKTACSYYSRLARTPVTTPVLENFPNYFINSPTILNHTSYAFNNIL